MRKLWEGSRPEGGPPPLDPGLEAFMGSTAVDGRLLREDIEGSIAHAAMLGERGIVSRETAAALAAALGDLAAEAGAGRLAVDPAAEDVHSFVENLLTERIGDAGRSLHAGRSRNDQVALDLRLWLRGANARARAALAGALGAVLELARGHERTIMPGYTHLQRAQPVTLAHHLLAWAAALERDLGRLEDADARADECPLGACALAGSSLPLDREAVARDLGFARPTRNSMDSVADRDACVEFAAACATIMMHLSRFAEEICLWTSAEFGFARLSAAVSTGSSVMPQKRNPDPAELIRGKSGRSFGALLNLLVIQKGLPLAYDRDLQEDKAAVFDAADTATASLLAFATLVAGLEPEVARMAAAAREGYPWAADAAEWLALRGVPFRTAYGAAKDLVEACRRAGLADPAGLSEESLAAAHPGFAEAGAAHLAEYLAPEACVARRDLPGGPAPARCAAEIERLAALLAARAPGKSGDGSAPP